MTVSTPLATKGSGSGLGPVVNVSVSAALVELTVALSLVPSMVITKLALLVSPFLSVMV